MQGFCHVISDHLVCQTIFDVNVAFGLLISNTEVSDVQMMRVLASTLASIGLKQYGTYCVHIIGEMILSVATTSALVELLGFIPCFLLREVMAPSHIEKVEPV